MVLFVEIEALDTTALPYFSQTSGVPLVRNEHAKWPIVSQTPVQLRIANNKYFDFRINLFMELTKIETLQEIRLPSQHWDLISNSEGWKEALDRSRVVQLGGLPLRLLDRLSARVLQRLTTVKVCTYYNGLHAPDRIYRSLLCLEAALMPVDCSCWSLIYAIWNSSQTMTWETISRYLKLLGSYGACRHSALRFIIGHRCVLT